jgi:hypothetical protein
MAMKRLVPLPFFVLMLQGGCVTTDKGAPSLNIQHEIVYVDRPVAAVKAGDVPIPPCKSKPTPQETLTACLGTRPADARQALDLATARLLEMIGYADVADPLLQSAAATPEVPKRH